MQGLEKIQVAIILQLEKLFRIKCYRKLSSNSNTKKPTISVIIPTLNEAANIGRLVRYLLKYRTSALEELIVVDGGSQDETVLEATNAGATLLECTHCGRAYQMNQGAAIAKGTILYFVHSDTVPPPTYLNDILAAVQLGHNIGCFRALYEHSKYPLLKINSYCTRFPVLWCRGGDQSLFITQLLFKQLDGYDEEYQLMEEYALIAKAQEKEPFKIISKNVQVSIRKYEQRGYFKVQLANLVAFNLFRFGVSQDKLVSIYKRMLK